MFFNKENWIKNMEKYNIIVPDIFYKNYLISVRECYWGPRVHKFENVKIIFNELNFIITIKSTKKNSLFAIDYLSSIMDFIPIYNIKSVIFNDENIDISILKNLYLK